MAHVKYWPPAINQHLRIRNIHEKKSCWHKTLHSIWDRSTCLLHVSTHMAEYPIPTHIILMVPETRACPLLLVQIYVTAAMVAWLVIACWGNTYWQTDWQCFTASFNNLQASFVTTPPIFWGKKVDSLSSPDCNFIFLPDLQCFIYTSTKTQPLSNHGTGYEAM